MANSQHLNLARAGKSAWDSWRRSYPSEPVDFSGTDFTAPENRNIIFSGFEFDGEADFSDTVFGDTPIPYQVHGSGRRVSPEGAALFDRAVFREETNFRRARFGHNARFDGVIFEKGVNFTDAKFLSKAEFSSAVFSSAGFSYARFGDYARFDGVLFIKGPSFESAVFGNRATFEGASFERAFFYMSHFGHQPEFDYSVFAAKDMAVQFNDAVFGDNASFKGAAFECHAYFNEAEFGDRANFEARDQIAFRDSARERSRSLPEQYCDLYLTRANAANPQALHDITFSGARFGEGTVVRPRSESWTDTIRLFFPRLLHSAESRRMRALDPGPGASFRGRLLQGVCDFSRVRFDQPPEFGSLGQVDNLDLSGTSFSFRGATWVGWRYWTTDTVTATRIRRLRKLASDIHAEDAERDLLALSRMVGLGIEWSMWWANVVRCWDHHRMMRPAAVDQPGRQRRKPHWLGCLVTSVWFAVSGVGRPAVWTVLTLLYRTVSDFGRSVVLPTLWLIVSLMAFGVWYSKYTTMVPSPRTAKALAIFTLANSVPFASSSRKAFDDSVAVLFASGIPIAVHIIGLLNGLVSALLIFLIILAVRNRLRIG